MTEGNRSFPWVKAILASVVAIVLVLAVGAMVIVGGAAIFGMGVWGLLVSTDADQARAEAREARAQAASSRRDAEEAGEVYKRGVQDVADVAVKAIEAPRIVAAKVRGDDCEGGGDNCVRVTCDLMNAGGSGGSAVMLLGVTSSDIEVPDTYMTEDVWLEAAERKTIVHEFSDVASGASVTCQPTAD